MSTEKKSWVGTLIAGIVSLFHKADPIIDDIIKWSEGLVNVIKKAEASQAGQLLESTIESVWPPSSTLINAFKLWLPKAGAIISNIENFEDLTDKEKMEAFLQYLSHLKAADTVLYAGVLNTLSASIQQFFATNEGVALTVQQSLAVSQPAHDETLGVIS